MRHPALLLALLAPLLAPAQSSDSLAYAVSHEPIVGLVATADTTLVFQGGVEASGDALLPPLVLRVAGGRAELVPLDDGEPIATFDTYTAGADGPSYALEAALYNCDAGYSELQLRAYAGGSLRGGEVVVALPDADFDYGAPRVAVTDSSYVLVGRGQLLTGRLDRTRDAPRFELPEVPYDELTQVSLAVGPRDGQVYLTYAGEVYRVDPSDGAGTIVALGTPVLTAPALAVGVRAGEVYALHATGATILVGGEAVARPAVADNTTLLTAVAHPSRGEFLCTYVDPAGVERYGHGTVGADSVRLTAGTPVDTANPAVWTEFVGDGTYAAVLAFERHDVDLVLSSSGSADELARFATRAVSLEAVEARLDGVIGGFGFYADSLTVTSTVSNPGADTLDRLDLYIDRFSDRRCAVFRPEPRVYRVEGLALLPGETRTLDPFVLELAGNEYWDGDGPRVTLRVSAVDQLPPAANGASVRTAEASVVVADERIAERTLRAYPNPAHEVLTVEHPVGAQVRVVEVCDALGRRCGVDASTDNALAVAQLSAGMYVARFRYANGAVGQVVFRKG